MENSQYWYNKAMDRLMIHVQNDVTQSGVHKEHSPYYHNITLDLFRGSVISSPNLVETEMS